MDIDGEKKHAATIPKPRWNANKEWTADSAYPPLWIVLGTDRGGRFDDIEDTA